MALDDKLLEILACPNCRGDLEYLERAGVLVCRGRCGYRYPIRDGIPVLLVDEAEKPDTSTDEQGGQPT
ncbi:MAG: Trm112 family protein [Actinomycetota bacterium]|nr:Trm112 family protein [Actinomycetota bacterium]